MRCFRRALTLALALCAAPALVLARPDAKEEAAARAAVPVLPLRPVAQHGSGALHGDNFIVGGELADVDDSKWVVALVTNSRVRIVCRNGLDAPGLAGTVYSRRSCAPIGRV